MLSTGIRSTLILTWTILTWNNSHPGGWELSCYGKQKSMDSMRRRWALGNKRHDYKKGMQFSKLWRFKGSGIRSSVEKNQSFRTATWFLIIPTCTPSNLWAASFRLQIIQGGFELTLCIIECPSVIATKVRFFI